MKRALLGLALLAFASSASAQVVSTNSQNSPPPVYSSAGSPVASPHAVVGSTTLTLGSSTVTFTGSAVFTSTSTFWCTASDTSSTASPTNAQIQSASSVRLLSTDASAVVSYICMGW